MGSIINAIRVLSQFAKSHRWKLAAFVPLVAIWCLVFFPYTDLRSVAVTRLDALKANGITLDFRSLNLNFPLSLRFTDVQIVRMGFEQIKLDSLEISPALSSLFFPITGRGAQASLSVGGLFGGLLEATIAQKKGSQAAAASSESETAPLSGLIALKLNGSAIDAGQLTQWLSRSGLFRLKGMTGEVSLDLNAEIPLGAGSFPVGQLNVNGDQLKLPSIAIPLQGSEVRIPKLSLTKLILQGSTENGVINLETIQLGQSQKDALSGKISGVIPMGFLRPGLAAIEPGAPAPKLELRLDLTFKKRLHEEMMRYGGGGLLFIALDACKTNPQAGSPPGDMRFNCKIELDSPFSQPRITKI